MGWAVGAWAEGAWAGTAWAVQSPPVEVPDVVGETEAAATSTLEGEGFVVAVAAAHSPTVEAGLVISQAPTAGSFATPGSTVTITVSLGPAPVTDTLSGGWAFFNEHAAELQRRQARERRRRELFAELEQIQDEATQEIAVILHEQDDSAEREAEQSRLRELMARVSEEALAREFGERVATAYQRAFDKATYSALEALVREAKRAQEEEEFLLLTALVSVH